MQLLSNIRNGKLPVHALMLFGYLRRHELSTTKTDIAINSNIQSKRHSWQRKFEKKLCYLKKVVNAVSCALRIYSGFLLSLPYLI
jgi:hypothetical protein